MPFMTTVRYGLMKAVDSFRCETPDFNVNDTVVVKSPRGIEMGTVMAPVTFLDEDLANSEIVVLRNANPKDLEIQAEMDGHTRDADMSFARRKIEEHGLKMKLVEVEHLFGSGRIIFYFSAEGRVDFRSLVKDLASEFKTRIEMKQIGVRDEARILGDIGVCGRELCCRRHIKDFDPIGMKMAKMQKDSLDPTKISGRCGRLMCCLRYEYETYRELQKALPKRGTSVITPEGRGEVISGDIIGQSVNVALADKRIVTVGLDELLDKPPKDKERSRRNDRSERSDRGNRGRDNREERNRDSRGNNNRRDGGRQSTKGIFSDSPPSEGAETTEARDNNRSDNRGNQNRRESRDGNREDRPRQKSRRRRPNRGESDQKRQDRQERQERGERNENSQGDGNQRSGGRRRNRNNRRRRPPQE